MAKKKKPVRGTVRRQPVRKASAVRPSKTPESMKSSSRSTMSGPSVRPGKLDSIDALARKAAAAGDLAAAMPENPTKAGEYGDAAREPEEGAHVAPRDPS